MPSPRGVPWIAGKARSSVGRGQREGRAAVGRRSAELCPWKWKPAGGSGSFSRGQRRAQPVGIVGDQPSTPADQPLQVGGVVDGPGITVKPRLRLGQRAVSRVGKGGGRPVRPAACTRRGAEPPDRARRVPPSRGTGPACHAGCCDAPRSTVRQTRRSAARYAGTRAACASRRTARVTRAPSGSRPPNTAAAKISGSAISAPGAGVSLVSMLKRTYRPCSPRQVEHLASVGMRAPRPARCSGKLRGVGGAGLERPTS